LIEAQELGGSTHRKLATTIQLEDDHLGYRALDLFARVAEQLGDVFIQGDLDLTHRRLSAYPLATAQNRNAFMPITECYTTMLTSRPGT
jgi:hypothetical protein